MILVQQTWIGKRKLCFLEDGIYLALIRLVVPQAGDGKTLTFLGKLSYYRYSTSRATELLSFVGKQRRQVYNRYQSELSYLAFHISVCMFLCVVPPTLLSANCTAAFTHFHFTLLRLLLAR